MSDLKIIISEQITLPNKNIETSLNTVTISGVNQMVKRVDTISTTFSGSGIEILKFVDSEEQQTAGSFVKDQVKYIRITNLSSTGSAEIYLISTGNESSIFQLDSKKSLMLSNAEFNASSTNDYVVENYVDETYYSNFYYYDTVKAKASGSNIQLEYVVASS
jgi:hypothetical protein